MSGWEGHPGDVNVKRTIAAQHEENRLNIEPMCSGVGLRE